MGWAWDERKDKALVFGDAWLDGLMLTQRKEGLFAVALDTGIILVHGLGVTRKGFLKARNFYFSFPWEAIVYWTETTVQVDGADRSVLFLSLTPQTAGWRDVLIHQNLKDWELVLHRKGVRKDQP